MCHGTQRYAARPPSQRRKVDSFSSTFSRLGEVSSVVFVPHSYLLLGQVVANGRIQVALLTKHQLAKVRDHAPERPAVFQGYGNGRHPHPWLGTYTQGRNNESN